MARPRLLLLLPSTTYRATAFVEAARRLAIDLTVASDHVSVFAKAEPTGLMALDLDRPERVADAVRVFAAEHPVSAVFGVDDDTAVVAAVIAEALGLPHDPVAATLAARDKHRQRTLLAQAGLPVPAFTLHAVTDDPGPLSRATAYPVVLKPLRLSASRGVIRADDPAGFVAAFRRIARILEEPEAAACGEPARKILAEAFVPGAEVALEGVMEDGRLRVLALFDKPDPLDGPCFEETIYVTPSRLPDAAQRDVARCADGAARALGLTRGPVHAELRVNGSGPWVIEVAARPIGGRCGQVLRFGEGEGASTLEELLLRHALGMPDVTWERERAASGVMMIPTPHAGTLEEVRGVDRARAVPLVDDVIITAHRGQQLVPLPEGSRYVGFIFARGDAPAAVTQALRDAHAVLEIVIR